MTKKGKIIVGVDEAGRGPVLGPLVMVALAIKEEDQKKLKLIGVKDSKLLSAERREELFGRIKEIVTDFRIEAVEPDAIDLSLSENNSNLNWLEADTSARLVSELDPDKIIVDCPSRNISKYKDYFNAKLSPAVRDKAEIVMEHKADFNHIIVAAASIVAKVIRDSIVNNLKSEIKIDFGSGYLTDSKTQKFLNEYYDKYPHLFRKKWQPYKNVEEKKKQRTLENF